FYDYSPQIKNTSHVDAELAASQAAYTVLSELYPDQQEMIDAFFDDVLAGARRGAVTANCRALGRAIGVEVIAARADDGSGNVVDYEYGDGIGVFQADPLNPDVPVWGPGWGEVETFAISAAEDFAPETTPPITSEEYAASYNEVKELGSVDSQTRTADETETGIFWAYDREGLGTPLALYNDVLETIAIQQGNSLKENAALFAQASVAMADAAIVAWHTKFGEEFWRPVTAIHEGDNDGNDLTEGDENWTALGAPDGEGDIIGFTPQFPTYISGHATFGGAVFGALQQFYGTDDIAFELDSRELEILLEDPDLMEAYGLDLDDATRSFDSLSEAMAENGRSRVYLGIHFDFDDLVGQEVGQAVAAAVSSEFSVPTNGRDDGKGPKRGKDRDGKRPGRGGEGKSKRDKDGKKDGKRGDRSGVPLLVAGKKSGKPAGRGFTYFNSDDSSDGRGTEDNQKSPPPGRNEPVRVVDLDRDDDRPGKKQPPGENDGLLEYVGRRSKRKG
ncbi:MAG: vanadium-dependent haloperoxidase, partial [Planctomycetota bacterium]